jgi:hypothetical protein
MRTITIASMTLAAVLVSAVAHAETANDSARPDGAEGVAPANAFELSIGQGLTQGFGQAGEEGTDLRDLGGLGPSLQLGLGYRIDPRFMVGGYLEGARFSGSDSLPDGTHSYTAAVGVQGQYHFRPFSKLDPWVGVGTGFRSYWVDRPDAPHRTLHGWEIARLRVGVDYRLGPSTSMGPMLGGSLSTFTVTERPNSSAPETIEDPGLSGFLFAGFQGRFDIGGERVSATPKQVASR